LLQLLDFYKIFLKNKLIGKKGWQSF